MANEWKVVIPETTDTTNLVTNPSIEVDTTGYTAVGGSVARSTTQQKRGGYSLVVTPTSGVNDGVYYGTVSLTSGQSYTYSVDLFGVDTIPYRIYFATTGAVVKGTPTEVTGNGDWQRVTVAWTADATASFRLYVVKNSHASTGIFYVDGVQCVNLAYDVLYIDGDQAGCKWNGTHHASTSKRYATSRAGGQEVTLETYNMYLTELQGVGMPPVSHKVLEHALQDGAIFRGSKVLPRSFALVGTYVGASTANLHSQRKDLLDAIKPDRRGNDQPFLLRYYGANSVKPVEIACQFDAETGNQDYLFYQRVANRLMAYDPYFYEEGNAAKHLTTQTSTTARSVIGKIDGAWNVLGPLSSTVSIKSIAVDEQYIYIGTQDTNINGIADADDIARYDKETGAWSALGTGMNGIVYVLAIGPDGALYAGGTFTTAGGGAASRIAKWDGSSWSALGSGTDGDVYAIAFGNDGTLYVGGLFNNAGGGAANNIAKWDGSSWSALGTGMNASVLALVMGIDGNIYAGGNFTTAGGTTVDYVARWNGSAWSALATGTDANLNALAVAPNGILYIGGVFTTAGGVSANRVAYWNGSSFVALGDGVNNTVNSLKFTDDGLLYVGGQFTSAGGIPLADRAAIWNGSIWAHIDIDIPGSPVIFALAKDGDDLYIGFDTGGTGTYSAITTVTNNGSRATYPIFVLKRSGGTSATLEYIKNEDTGNGLWFNYALLDGETITIDFTPGNRKVTSDFFGEVPYAILRGSDFAEFSLLPGDNDISVYVAEVGSPTLTCYLQYRQRHWSVDGVAA